MQIGSGETATVAQAMANVRSDMEESWMRRSREAAGAERERLLTDSPWLRLRIAAGSACLMEGEIGQ